MPAPDRTYGFRVLDDFVCDAVSNPPATPSGRLGRGVNPGMSVVSELPPSTPPLPLPAEQVAELRLLSTPELLRLVRQSGPKLSGVELLVIHDIAAERLTGDDELVATGALDVSRETMRLAVSRCA